MFTFSALSLTVTFLVVTLQELISEKKENYNKGCNKKDNVSA